MRVFPAILALTALTACGQKGPLYLEKEQSGQPESVSSRALTAETDDDQLLASRREQGK